MIKLRALVSRIEPILLLVAGIACVLFAAWPGDPFSLTASRTTLTNAQTIEAEDPTSASRFSSATPFGLPGTTRAQPSRPPELSGVPQPPIGDEALQRELDAANPRAASVAAQQGNLSFLDNLLTGFENGVAIETFEDWHPTQHIENLPVVPAPTPRPYFDPDAQR